MRDTSGVRLLRSLPALPGLFAQGIAAERPEAAQRGAEDLKRKARFFARSAKNAPKRLSVNSPRVW
jgi:hypothetical protein